MKPRRSPSSVRFMTTITKDFVWANDIDIHYIDAGATDAPPLVLLHGGLVSTSEIWAPIPISYASQLRRLAEEFHIIAPDARGSAMTSHSGGPVSMSVLADDVAGLIDALGLDRPAVAGFSEGGLVALLLGIRHPDSMRALVCDSGYDLLNPDAPAFAMLPALLGGLPHVDPDVVEQSFGQDPEMAEVFALMKADQDAARGEGYCRALVALARLRLRRSRQDHRADLDPGRRSRPLLLCGGGCGGIQEPRPWPARRDTKHRPRDQHRQDRGTSQLPHQLDRATPGEEQHSEDRPSSSAGHGQVHRRSRKVGSARPDPDMINIAERPAEAEAIIGR
jgi:pimeloyl-ACP methyl ester carboxylesterase